MSSIKLTADSGGGTVELKAPATTGSNAARQLTIPDTYSGNGSVVTSDSNGKIGLNVSSPTELLTIGGCAEFKAFDNNSGGGGFHSTGFIIGNAFSAGKAASVSDDRNMIVWNERGLDIEFGTSNSFHSKFTYDGKIELGNNSSASHTSIDIRASDFPTFRLYDDASSDNFVIRYENSTQRTQFINNHNGVYLERGGNGFSALSDERAKTIVSNITGGLEKIKGLRTVIGNYTDDPDKYQKPFLIAQDVQAVLPEAVSTRDADNLGLCYTEVIPLLTNALQEAVAKIETLETNLTALTTRVATLETS